MTLEELISALEAEDPNLVLPDGFTNPHSYRGYYDELAFEPAQNVTVGAMLADARTALGSTYTGWKGGEYTMGSYTDCWLAVEGCLGETIGPILLKLMIDVGKYVHRDLNADPEALAWARAKAEKIRDKCRAFEAEAQAQDRTEPAAMWRRFAWFLETQFIGGKGCVVAAFDERRPAFAALETRVRTTEENAR